MQFGAIFWTNFKENYCKFLTFLREETKKGFWPWVLGAEAYFSPRIFDGGLQPPRFLLLYVKLSSGLYEMHTPSHCLQVYVLTCQAEYNHGRTGPFLSGRTVSFCPTPDLIPRAV